MARIVDQGAIENVYRLQLMHALEHPQCYRIRVSSPDATGLVAIGMVEPELATTEERTVPIAVRLPAAEAQALAGQSIAVQFHVQPVDGAPDVDAVVETSRFLVPR
jgi:hypothetical protein